MSFLSLRTLLPAFFFLSQNGKPVHKLHFYNQEDDYHPMHDPGRWSAEYIRSTKRKSGPFKNNGLIVKTAGLPELTKQMWKVEGKVNAGVMPYEAIDAFFMGST